VTDERRQHDELERAETWFRETAEAYDADEAASDADLVKLRMRVEIDEAWLREQLTAGDRDMSVDHVSSAARARLRKEVAAQRADVWQRRVRMPRWITGGLAAAAAVAFALSVPWSPSSRQDDPIDTWVELPSTEADWTEVDAGIEAVESDLVAFRLAWARAEPDFLTDEMFTELEESLDDIGEALTDWEPDWFGDLPDG
jgi:hypothetical protein